MHFDRKKAMGALVLVLLLAFVSLFIYDISPAASESSGKATPTVFEVRRGDGFRQIAAHLYADGLIRSPLAFEALALLGGKALTLKPGLYKLSSSMSAEDIVQTLAGENAGEATVTIPEGSNIYQIDKLLSDALVIQKGALINFNNASGTSGVSVAGNLEGKLFPDTYEFFTGADVKDVVQEFLDNFGAKAAPALAAGVNWNSGFATSTIPKSKQVATSTASTLVIASILEKEVPMQSDQKLVAGIIEKRLSAGMPLDIDATVCYAKLLTNGGDGGSASPGACVLSPLDLKLNSPYNTYLYKGLPPGPIGNPGISAIQAAENPQNSPYWYYLSDPASGKTIFAKTLDEQNQNKVKYLKGN